MERAAPRASGGRRGPAVIVLAAAVLLSACVGSETAATASPVATLAPATPPVTPSPSASEIVDPSVDPSTDPEATPSESPLASPSSAAACTGTESNRTFLATVAEKVSWDVYCAVLPRGWSVEAGSYRTSAGGWLKISYKASGDRRLELREGAFCTSPDYSTCVPSGQELAPGPFADREATVLQVEDGGFAMIVDSGQKISWVAIGKGMDETTFRAYAEALTLVVTGSY